MSKLIILNGNIGTGKSTLAKEYAKEGYYIVSKDSIRYMVGAGSYRFEPKTEHIIASIETHSILEYMANKCPILIDGTGINIKQRSKYIRTAKLNGYRVIAVIMPEISLEETLRRKVIVDHDQSSGVWEGVYYRFREIYETPCIEEGIDEIITKVG